jgi:hypothetical protein
VDPTALTRYGSQLSRAADDAIAGQSYLAKYGHADDANGWLYQAIFSCHVRAVQEIEGAFGRLAGDAQTGNAGLSRAATFYAGTDHAAAARFDDGLPLVPCQPVSDFDQDVGLNDCPLPFADARAPRDRLEEPDVPDAPGGFFANPFGFVEMFSPSALVLEVLNEVFGFDPIEKLAGMLAGDWEKLYECGSACQNLSECAEDIAINVDAGARNLDSAWTGNAADAAVQYFKRFADSIDGLPEPLRQIAEAHKQAALAAWRTAEAAKAAVGAMIDKAIAVAAMSAAGTALIETGIGAVMAYGAAAWQLAGIFEEFEAATRTVHLLYDALLGLIGVIEAAVVSINGLPQVKIISEQYRFPA